MLFRESNGRLVTHITTACSASALDVDRLDFECLFLGYAGAVAIRSPEEPSPLLCVWLYFHLSCLTWYLACFWASGPLSIFFSWLLGP
ncbi:hypothetical protein APHAL10511_001331 [Amanita phalloides]|nr:hypothetical protein APHAL10511_001331 [Amanita phalloides]